MVADVIRAMGKDRNEAVSMLTVKEGAIDMDREGASTPHPAARALTSMDHVKCYRCCKIGHFQRDCRGKQSRGESTFRHRRHGGNSGGNHTPCGRHYREQGGGGGSGSQTYATLLVGKDPRDKKRENMRNKWIIDSGATCHMTNSKDAVDHLRTATNEYVTVGEGTKKPVRGQGTVQMEGISNGAKKRVVISNVAVVHERLCSLLSVSCFRRGGYRVEFSGSGNQGTVDIIRQKTGEFIARGIENAEILYERLMLPCRKTPVAKASDGRSSDIKEDVACVAMVED